MMPQTVPNRPTKGDTEPTVASKPSWRSMPSVSRRMVTLIALSMRSLTPGIMALARRAGPSKARRHSRRRRDEHGGQGMVVAGGELLIKFVQRLAGPEQLLEARAPCA